jgi:putative addiction module CopG family antidote
MKLSISLPQDDLEFIDEQTGSGAFASRSAAVHAAIRLLRDRAHVDSYAAAWDEWDADGGAVWEAVAADGVR